MIQGFALAGRGFTFGVRGFQGFVFGVRGFRGSGFLLRVSGFTTFRNARFRVRDGGLGFGFFEVQGFVALAFGLGVSRFGFDGSGFLGLGFRFRGLGFSGLALWFLGFAVWGFGVYWFSVSWIRFPVQSFRGSG